MEERLFLRPLPQCLNEYADWKKATVQLNYHIMVENQNYSVPYEYVRKRADVRLTSHVVEIYTEGRRIANHKRIIGKRGQYSTVEEHMSKNHQLYSQWDGNRFRRWLEKCGEHVHTVIERLLASYRVEE